MPVAAEPTTDRPTRRGRGCLWALLVLMALVLLLLGLLLTRPMDLMWGNTVVVAYWERATPGSPGLYAEDRDGGGTSIHAADGTVYVCKGGLHVRSVSIGRWEYFVWWFEGKR